MNIMYPKKLIETSTHGKSGSQLIKTMSKNTPTVPSPISCTPIGFSTIRYLNDSINRIRFKVNDEPILSLDSINASEPSFVTFINLMVGIHGDMIVRPPVTLISSLQSPTMFSLLGNESVSYEGGITETGTVNMLGHDISIENTVMTLPDMLTGEITYCRLGKVIKNPYKVEIHQFGDESSYYDTLLEYDFNKYQSDLDYNWNYGDPIIGVSCGGFPMVSFVPEALGDTEISYVYFSYSIDSDAFDDELFYGETITINGNGYIIADVLDAHDGIVVNDGVVRLESKDGGYRISSCCTVARQPITISIQNPYITFEDDDTDQTGLFKNFKITDNHRYDAVITPPAITPFRASNIIKLYMSNTQTSKLWGVISINGVSYGRQQFIDGFGTRSVFVNGLEFECRYDDDSYFIMSLGELYSTEVVNENIYYKIEIEFETGSNNLKPSNVEYKSNYNFREIVSNETSSLNVNANKVTAFMKYVQYQPM